MANSISVELIDSELKKHLNNTYFKEIQVPNINEAKILKKERAKLTKEIYDSFWKMICFQFHYEYKDKHSEIIINKVDVDDINFFSANFYLDDILHDKLQKFKANNDRFRSIKVQKDNKYFKEKLQKYIKEVI